MSLPGFWLPGTCLPGICNVAAAAGQDDPGEPEAGRPHAVGVQAARRRRVRLAAHDSEGKTLRLFAKLTLSIRYKGYLIRDIV